MGINTCLDLINIRKKSWFTYKNTQKDEDFRELVVRDYLLKDSNLRQEIQEHPERLIELQFIIVNKEQETVPFFLNEVQKEFLTDVVQAVGDYNAGRRLHLNFLVLKGRQQGQGKALYKHGEPLLGGVA